MYTKIKESNEQASQCKENMLKAGWLVAEIIAIEESYRVTC